MDQPLICELNLALILELRERRHKVTASLTSAEGLVATLIERERGTVAGLEAPERTRTTVAITSSIHRELRQAGNRHALPVRFCARSCGRSSGECPDGRAFDVGAF
jgi:hypothetical protein